MTKGFSESDLTSNSYRSTVEAVPRPRRRLGRVYRARSVRRESEPHDAPVGLGQTPRFTARQRLDIKAASAARYAIPRPPGVQEKASGSPPAIR